MHINQTIDSKKSYDRNATLLFDQVYLESLRRQMVKFVLLQISSSDEAEDIVQEALLSAFKYADRFRGKSAFKTWVFSILKNKMIDSFRKKSCVSTLSELVKNDDDAEKNTTLIIDQAFEKNGHWATTTQSNVCQSPEKIAENDEFWLIFDACLNGLPTKNAQVFIFREIMDLPTTEICQELNLSISNFNVIMYRTRMKLSKCLENKWD